MRGGLTEADAAQAPIRCLLADDHEILLEAVAKRFEDEDGIELVGTASDGTQALLLIERRRPDVAVVDIHMPGLDGVALSRAVTERELPTLVLLYTGEVDREVIRRGLAAGARGVLLKSGDPSGLTRAVRAIVAGATYVEPTLAGALMEQAARAPGAVLAKRELEVLQLIANGVTGEGIAAELSLSPNTVRSYVESAVRKLGARGRTHAVAEAFRRQLIV
jgi:DNA-binding NarL/FixJ family response regulator